jgi:hypothetical protein
LNLTLFPACDIIPAMNVETAFYQPARSEISIIQGRQLSEQFLQSMIYSDLQNPAGFHGLAACNLIK